jgi:hypothetical protein
MADAVNHGETECKYHWDGTQWQLIADCGRDTCPPQGKWPPPAEGDPSDRTSPCGGSDPDPRGAKG